ncbi:S8 family peptidase [Deinococcus sp. HMF7604]|uniref:S8 family peptidase n=1 Tax=Deinococcus betulae TaxID=2873312 RepID=UPI001CCE6CAE|nr:S8 family peptidase [Deinococcus betulae]MBZ9752268.1 S8 family peptidase [Deinococcus betulae]
MNVRLATGTLGLTLLLAACGQQTPTAQQPTAQPKLQGSLPTTVTRTAAPLLGTSNPAAIPGQYIVVLSEGAVSNLSVQSAGGLVSSLGLNPQGVTIQHVYGAALNGFAAKLSAQNLQTLRSDPRVKYIEQDSTFTASATQSNATWGIDRVDQRSLPLSGTYTYDVTASNVTAYIIDTGIRTTHQQYGGRAVWGINQTGDGQNTDCNGHGTHVAGTVGSTTYGVAKSVKLVAVKVLGCDGSGSNSGIIAGVNWAVSNKSGPAVANMSLGGGFSQASNDAVTNAYNKGLFIAVAAGNNNGDACQISPASAPNAFTVGATTKADRRADPQDWGYDRNGNPLGSNYGTCVDILAPGTGILSTVRTSDTSVDDKNWNGTSMATPHVTGAAALVLSANPSYTPAQVASALNNTATTGKLTNLNGSPNKLLFTNPGGGTTPTPDPDPTPTPGSKTYTGTVNAGQFSYQPGTAGFTYAGGTLKATLTGATGTDFDLYLLKKNTNGTWAYVAESETPSSSETITYNATSGTYVWGVYGYAGSGQYTLVETK